MKKIIYIMLVTVFFTTLLSSCGNGNLPDDDEVIDVGNDFINDYFDEDYENMLKDYVLNSDYKESIDETIFQNSHDAFIKQWGDVKSKGKPTSYEESGNTIVSVPVEFEDVEFNFIVTFDSDNRIIDLGYTY